MNFRYLAASVRPRGRVLALLTATALAIPFAAQAQTPPAPGAKAAPKAAPKAAVSNLPAKPVTHRCSPF